MRCGSHILRHKNSPPQKARNHNCQNFYLEFPARKTSRAVFRHRVIFSRLYPLGCCMPNELCHNKPSGFALNGIAGGDFRQFCLEALAVQPMGFYPLPGHFIAVHPHFLLVAQRGFDLVPDSLGLCFGLFNQSLQALEFLDFLFHFHSAHKITPFLFLSDVV